MLQAIKPYFNRYKFKVFGHNATYGHFPQNLTSSLFDFNLCKKPAVIKYITKPTDPAVKFLTNINPELAKVESGIKILKQNDESHPRENIVVPYGLVPTHQVLRIRDILLTQKIKTYLKPQKYYDEIETALEHPFCTKIQLTGEVFDKENKIIKLNVLSNNSILEDSKMEETLINHLIETEKLWNSFEKNKQKELLEVLSQDYRKNVSFEVYDKQWSSYDGLQPSHDIYNKAGQYMYFSKYVHSVGQITNEFSSEGGLGIETYCPINKFLCENISYYTIRFGIEGNVAGSSYYFPKNFVPFWKMTYLKESINDFGVKTSQVSLS
jgi:hypothetical protein